MTDRRTLTPGEIVAELDRSIVGQTAAKRAVAIALRNRYRRAHLADEALRAEITPKNILMMGPTGVGKTEIARRLARLAGAPFLKVEATRFTEVGYVGRDVDSIVRDLVEVAIKDTREAALAGVTARASELATERVLDALLPRGMSESSDLRNHDANAPENPTRARFRRDLAAGSLDDREIEMQIVAEAPAHFYAPPGLEEMAGQLQHLFQGMGNRPSHTRRLKVREARTLLVREEALKLLDEDAIRAEAVQNASEHGIVFIDEIDKIVGRAEGVSGGAGVSREGVQRDLLPLIEGSAVNTRYGVVRTDHILFIASGAFHLVKPSDLIAELQGRLPIRVELEALGVAEFVRILTEPSHSLTEQYGALLATEGVSLEFTTDGVSRLAEIAWRVNERTENIGARRLHTVLERLLEEVSFAAPESAGPVRVDAAYVDQMLGGLWTDDNLARYIL